MNVDASRPDAATDASPSTSPEVPRSDRDDVSQDDRDIGWGESPRPSERDDEWYQRERPPHHG